MISLGAFLIFAVAVSIIVSYVMIIHKSLSGEAANNPEYDINAGHRAPAAPSNKASSVASSASLSGRGTPRHA